MDYEYSTTPKLSSGSCRSVFSGRFKYVEKDEVDDLGESVGEAGGNGQ